MQRRQPLSRSAAGSLAGPPAGPQAGPQAGLQAGLQAGAPPLGAAAQARPQDVPVVANEFEADSLDIHTVVASRPGWGVRRARHSRLMACGKKKLPDRRVADARDKLAPELAEPTPISTSTLRDMVQLACAEVPRIPVMQPTIGVAMQKDVQGHQSWFQLQPGHRELSAA